MDVGDRATLAGRACPRREAAGRRTRPSENEPDANTGARVAELTSS